jgi:hypothetical protein
MKTILRRFILKTGQLVDLRQAARELTDHWHFSQIIIQLASPLQSDVCSEYTKLSFITYLSRSSLRPRFPPYRRSQLAFPA